MSDQSTSGTASARPVAGSPAGAGSLFAPSIYPFDVLQQLVDQTAYFPLYATPERNRTPVAGMGSPLFGAPVRHRLHRFQMHMKLANQERGVKAVNVIGEALGKANLYWPIIPDGSGTAANQQSPATLTPGRSQRFSLAETEFSFRDGRDIFRCAGVGRTFPGAGDNGSELLIAASGNIIEGTGVFSGLQGTCIFAGMVDSNAGFVGSIIARVTDPEDKLTAEVIAPLERRVEMELDATYFLFRGHKPDPSDATKPASGAQGGGFDLNQVVRVVYPDCSVHGARGIRSSRDIGPIIGKQAASVQFDPSQLANLNKPLGTVPFQGENTFTFADDSGREIGSIHNQTTDGTIFNLQLTTAPQQKAIRIAGFGPVTGGTGALAGVGGLFHSMAFTALPPIPSSVYVIRLNDPEGKYRE